MKNDFIFITLFQYCVASNSLSAITYWCQGKENCKFKPKWLISSTTQQQPSLFYLQNQGKLVKNYLQAVELCQEFGTLAKFEHLEDAKKALKLISKTNKTQNGFWIDAYTKDHFSDLGIYGVTGHMQDSCLVLIPDSKNPESLNIKWESCYDSKTKYGALCQAKLENSKIFGDNSCFEEINGPVLEYRLHFGKNLNHRDVNCPMNGILMRRGNTCYKTTDVTDWQSARAQCWSWGGELAFSLPDTDPECSAPIPGIKQEEVRIRSI